MSIGALEKILSSPCNSNTLIFCNKTNTAERLHTKLIESFASDVNDESSIANNVALKKISISRNIGEQRYVPSLLHGKFPEKQRRSVYEAFVDGKVRVLISTDLASRGLDTLNVGRVIMYDFCQNPIDFIHRAGRTGRSHGTVGEVFCLVSRKDLALATAIQRAISLGRPLTSPIAGSSNTFNGNKRSTTTSRANRWGTSFLSQQRRGSQASKFKSLVV